MGCWARRLARSRRTTRYGAGLVDEYVLVIQPVAFGSGLPLFADLPDTLRLELTGAKTFDSTVLHIYRPSDRLTR